MLCSLMAHTHTQHCSVKKHRHVCVKDVGICNQESNLSPVHKYKINEKALSSRVECGDH